MLNNYGMGFVFTAKDLASDTIAQVERSYSSLDERVGLGSRRMDRAFRDLGVGAGLATAGLIGLVGALALASVSGKFEQAIAQVGAVSNASAADLQGFRDAALDAGMATQYSPVEGAMALRELAQAGFSARESIQLLVPVLDLAGGSLGELTPQGAAGLAAQTMKVFGLEANQAGLAMDQLVASANLFALSAGELPLALGTAARGAQTLRQSLAETMITVGLIKNVIPGVERSSTAAAVAMERMANPAVQKQLNGIGVTVVGANGQFRAFLDILQDLQPALAKMTEAQRSAFLLQAFGTEALAGLNAVLEQLATGVKDADGNLRQGGAAIAYLRGEMANAGGTAQKFRDAMLGTFEGQKRLLGGAFGTLGIVLGESFAEALRPVVAFLAGALAALVGLVRSVPAPVKRAFALFTLGVATFLALAGGVIAAKAAMVLLVVGLKAIGLTLAGLAATLLPAIAVIGLLAAGVYGLYLAFQKNLGGIADFARSTWERVKLFFEGLRQLVLQGGFSGALREELGKAENQGLKAFLITAYAVVFRLQRIWEGFKASFSAAMQVAGPIIGELVAAFRDLGEQVARLVGGMGDAAASLPSARFASFGAVLGQVLGTVIGWIAQLVGWLTRLAAGVAAGFGAMMTYIRPALDAVGNALSRLSKAWDRLTGSTASSTDSLSQQGQGFRRLGEIIGRVFGAAVIGVTWAFAALIRVLEVAIGLVAALWQGFSVASRFIGDALSGVARWFTDTIPNAISTAVDWIAKKVSAIGEVFSRVKRWAFGLFDSIASGLRAFLDPVVEFFKGVGRAIKAVFDGIRDMVIKILREVPDELLPSRLERLKRAPLSTEVRSEDPFAVGDAGATTAARAAAASSSMPAAVEAQGRSGDIFQLAAAMRAMATERGAPSGKSQAVHVSLVVDGETLARAQAQAETDLANRSFSPVPVY